MSEHRELSPRVSAVRERLPKLRHFVVVDDESGDPSPSGAVPYEEALASASPKRQFAERSPDDLYIIYTGGTTGMPKGVMWRHEDFFYACCLGGSPFNPIAAPGEITRNAAPELGSARVTSGSVGSP